MHPKNLCNPWLKGSGKVRFGWQPMQGTRTDGQAFKPTASSRRSPEPAAASRAKVPLESISSL